MKHTKLFLISCMLTAMTVINTQGQLSTPWAKIPTTDDIFKNPPTGNVGIGIYGLPLQKLHLQNIPFPFGFALFPPAVAGIYAANNNNPVAIRFQADFSTQIIPRQSLSVRSFKWDIQVSDGDLFQIFKATPENSTYYAGNPCSCPVGPPTFSPVLTINGAGSVGIGTTTPGYKLEVKGTIKACEVRVNTTGCDFVFEKDYKLMSLFELEKFVIKNKHLPEIPTAKEMEENGSEVGVMQSKLLQKVEELTLHTIAINKQVENLKTENDELKKRIGELEKTNK